MTDIQIVKSALEAAKCPEDVFGPEAKLSHTYWNLVKVVHPDRNPGEEAEAKAVFILLQTIFSAAKEAAKTGSYGKRIPFVWKKPIQIGKYDCDPIPVEGDIAQIFATTNRKSLVKVTRHHDDNDLSKAEQIALRAMSKGIPQPVKDGVPELTDSFQLSGKWSRAVNVIRPSPGFLSLQQIQAKVGKVDPQTAVWMMKRGLTLLGWVNHLGFIHGAVLPCHVLVYPDNDGGKGVDPRKHSIRLVDWCYSVPNTRTRISAIVSHFEKLSFGL